MSTEKEPDYAGIAERLAEAYRIEQIMNGDGRCYEQAQAYASCMEARLRSDWETIRLLKQNATHDLDCNVTVDGRCVCGLSAHLSKLLEPFTP